MPFGFANPCQCGCHQYANTGREYIRGHDRRLYGVLRLARTGDESAQMNSCDVVGRPKRDTDRIWSRIVLDMLSRARSSVVPDLRIRVYLVNMRSWPAKRQPGSGDPARIRPIFRIVRLGELRSAPNTQIPSTVNQRVTRPKRVDLAWNGIYGASRSAIISEFVAAGLPEPVNLIHYNNRVHLDVPNWKLVPDSSIHGDSGEGVEVVSPVLHGSAGLATLKTAMECLSRAGARVDQSTGCHVHHSADDLSSATMARICRIYMVAQTSIDSMLASYRGSDRYCWPSQPYDENRVSSLESRAVQYPDPFRFTSGLDRYFSVNLAAYQQHQTVEFRQHQGTLNFAKVRAWVLLTRGILEHAVSGDTTLPATLDDLCHAANLPDDVTRYVTQRAEARASETVSSTTIRG